MLISGYIKIYDSNTYGIRLWCFLYMYAIVVLILH
jgi:hypothetical protein